MNLIILGAPGAGKGTQATLVAEKLDIAHISTGDLLRKEMKKGSEIGNLIVSTMNSGKFVDDDIITPLLETRLTEDDCKGGFILDGYPRNLKQAKLILSSNIKIDNVILIEMDEAKIVTRMSGRRICPSCNAVYNINSNPPKIEGICDKCGEPIIQREDDKEDVVTDRLNTYNEITNPVVEFFEEKNLLVRIKGIGNINEITDNIIKSIGVE